MTTEQRDYFVNRVNEIAREKVQAKAVELFGATGRPQQPTWGMVFEGIRSGEITLKADKVDYTGPYLNPSDVEWPAMEAKQAELEAYKAFVAQEKQSAMDGIMLDGAAKDALAAFAAI
jgi:hypothetical protein